MKTKKTKTWAEKNNEAWKKLIRLFNEMAPYITYLIGMMVLICGISLFWIGYHNFDSSQNWRWLEATFDINLRDHSSMDKYYTPMEGYLLGTDQIIISLPLIMFGIFLSSSAYWGGLKRIK